MIDAARSSEDSRQIVHIAMGGLALLLRFLTPYQTTVIAAGAVAFNLYALPRLAGTLYRPGETRRRLFSGIVLYPVAVLLLILALPDRRDIVAAAWGVLAFGDGMATLAGRHLASPRIPWNRDKSVAGSLAFILFGGAAGSLLCWWCRPAVIPPPYLWFSIGMPWVAAIAAAAVETIPISLDDNISVAAVASAILWSASLVSNDLAAATAAAARRLLPVAIAVNVVVAAAGYAARTVTLSGALCGAVIGIAIYVTCGFGGWGLLLATFAAAVVSSRVGLQRKTQLGIAEGKGGRRGAGNALANTGIAALAGLLSALSYAGGTARLAFVTALAAAGSDTVASEIGKAWGRHTVLLPTFTRVPPGTSGAISAEGTVAGLLGALLLGAIAVGASMIPASALPIVVLAATVGSLVESVMGATLEARGVVNNDVLNFLNTAIAALSAVFFAQTFQ